MSKITATYTFPVLELDSEGALFVEGEKEDFDILRSICTQFYALYDLEQRKSYIVCGDFDRRFLKTQAEYVMYLVEDFYASNIGWFTDKYVTPRDWKSRIQAFDRNFVPINPQPYRDADTQGFLQRSDFIKHIGEHYGKSEGFVMYPILTSEQYVNGFLVATL